MKKGVQYALIGIGLLYLTFGLDAAFDETMNVDFGSYIKCTDDNQCVFYQKCSSEGFYNSQKFCQIGDIFKPVYTYITSPLIGPDNGNYVYDNHGSLMLMVNVISIVGIWYLYKAYKEKRK